MIRPGKKLETFAIYSHNNSLKQLHMHKNSHQQIEQILLYDLKYTITKNPLTNVRGFLKLSLLDYLSLALLL